jgi:hypothetical protein
LITSRTNSIYQVKSARNCYPIIKEDRVGLDVIYIQAKKWEATVGRPEIQKFAGALQGFRAKKGIFITTSDFSKEAEDYASRIVSKRASAGTFSTACSRRSIVYRGCAEGGD